MLMLCRFVVDPDGVDAFVERANRALELLTAQPSCLGGQLCQSTDESDRWVLVVRFDSVVGYRRAMSPFAVREHMIPLLSEAVVDETAGYEVRSEAADGEVRELTSLLASDAGTVRLGEAAGPATAR